MPLMNIGHFNKAEREAILLVEWFRDNCPDFITMDERPPSSPDINALYCLWEVLKSEAWSTTIILKAKLKRVWHKINMKRLRAAINNFLERLRRVVKIKARQY